MESDGDARTGRRFSLGLVLEAATFAAVLVAAKAFVHARGWEFISTLPLLTGLMGGVVFTLAILLNATIRDYKEGEQLVALLGTKLRRLHAEGAHVLDGDAWTRYEASLAALARACAQDLTDGRALHMRRIHAAVAAVDAALIEGMDARSPAPQVRTVQVSLAEVVRALDRLEAIIETTAVRAGYTYAGFVVVVALGAFLFTAIDPLAQGLLLFGLTAFLLGGLFRLIWDLDNPFHGQVRVGIRAVERVDEAFNPAR